MKTILPVLFLSPLLSAQEVPVPCSTWFVDPVLGSNGNPGTLAFPLATLREAMSRSGVSPGPDGIVLLPGEYNDAAEAWPLVMLPDVSIQGTSALNTVLINRLPGPTSVLEFNPTTPTAYDNVVVDGVTIVGRMRCVQILDADVGPFRVRANPTFANCFLIDSIHSAVDLVVSEGGFPFPGHDADVNGLVEHRPKLINCTFVTSRIGVFNRIAAAMSFGESEPGLLNCLFSNNSISDLEGVDSLDVITSAFATADAAGLSPIKAGALPVPVFDTTVFPPDYVETTLGLALKPFDLRVRPASPAIDVGSLPPLAWGNGTTGQQFFACTMDIFDADCEGYGNPRVERVRIDIGAHEAGELLIAGYQRGTTALNSSLDSPFPGLMVIWLDPFPALPAGSYTGSFMLNYFPFIAGVGFWRPWSPVGIQDVRGFLTVPATPIPGLDTLWMDVSSFVPFSLTFTAPTTPVTMVMPPAFAVTQLEMQALPLQGVLVRPLSNLQTLFWAP